MGKDSSKYARAVSKDSSFAQIAASPGFTIRPPTSIPSLLSLVGKKSSMTPSLVRAL